MFIKKQGGILFFILAIICSGFFCAQNVLATEFEQGEVIFNEIAWMGTEVSTNDEWIELKNLTASDIDLTGWSIVAEDGSPEIELAGTISANSYFLLERTDDTTVSGIVADLIYTGVLGNDGEFLGLRDSEQNLIDFIDASSGWLTGDNDTKQTMERIGDVWQTSAEVSGTPKADNSSIEIEDEVIPDQPEEIVDEETEEETVEEEIGEENNSDSVSSCSLGDILINEFVSDPADGEVEWLELYNMSGKDVNLDSWTVEEGSGAKTVLKTVIPNYTFITIEKPSGNLNNKGDIIILKNAEGVLIDQVAYGDWDDGQTGNNAPVAGDPWSVARKMDGYNSFNNQNDFSITITPTKGESNIITSEEEAEEIITGYDYSQNIVISEVFPNPKGSDSETEFIELFNKGETKINLVGWRLGDDSQKKFEFGQGFEILPKGYLAIYRSESKIALNNSGDKVKLYQPFQDEPLQTITYGRAEENNSYALVNDNYEWTNKITPGLANQIDKKEIALIAEFDCPDILEVGRPFIFDGTDSLIEDSEEIIYDWDFGDGISLNLPSPEHTFLNEGVYIVKLKISNGEKEIIKEKTINIVKTLLGENSLVKSLSSSSIIINEFLPNPVGNDTDEEWIELYNPQNTPVNLNGWQIDDIDGGSRPFTFSVSSTIMAKSYFLLIRPESGLALNNQDDAVRLFNDSDVLVDSVEYGETFEGQSYARGKNNKWFWTASLTPLSENVIDVELDEASMNLASTGKNIRIVFSQEMTIEEARQTETGQFVKVQGIVAVEPNILASQYFYIIENNFGIQIYNYNKDFPILKVGDEVEIIGEISEINNEKRIKTKTISDFLILSSNQSIEPVKMKCEDINETNIGSLVQISGMVTERKSSTIYIDDGTDEAQIYIKSLTSISPKVFIEGAEYSTIGMVSQTKTGAKLMPRCNEDILKKDIGSNNESGRVLGEVSASDEWELAQRDKKLALFRYLLVIAGGVIIVLIGLLIKLGKK